MCYNYNDRITFISMHQSLDNYWDYYSIKAVSIGGVRPEYCPGKILYLQLSQCPLI